MKWAVKLTLLILCSILLLQIKIEEAIQCLSSTEWNGIQYTVEFILAFQISVENEFYSLFKPHSIRWSIAFRKSRSSMPHVAEPRRSALEAMA